MLDLYQKIEAYFDHELSAAERQEFEQQLKDDAAFAKTVEEYRAVREFYADQFENEAKEALLKQRLEAFGTQYFAESTAAKDVKPNLRVVARNRWIAWGLAMAATITLIVLFVWNRPEQDLLYAEYARMPQAAFIEKGTAGEALANAENHFNGKNYAAALNEIDGALQDAPTSTELLFFKGLCLLQLDRLQEARQLLEPIANSTSAFSEDAQWYLALSYLKSKEYSTCRTILSQIPPTGIWHEKAGELLSKIE